MESFCFTETNIPARSWLSLPSGEYKAPIVNKWKKMNMLWLIFFLVAGRGDLTIFKPV